MKYNRRNFLKLTAGAASGVMVAGTTGLLSGCETTQKSHYPFGVQLYTLRDVIADNPRETLRQLAEFGYNQIESYEGPQGMFWNMSPGEFGRYVDSLGMDVVSSHCNVFENIEQKAGEAAEAGLTYLICPWIGPQDTLDDYKRYAEQFNEIGQVCKNAGLKFAYHNHGYTYEELEGRFPQDVLMEDTDPELVEQQMDIYWVVTAGQDPEEWIKKYPNRFTSSHVKDRADVASSEQRASTTLGTGVIDYQKVLKAAYENGMRYFFVEQEEYEGTTPMDAVRDGAEYMKQIKLK